MIPKESKEETIRGIQGSLAIELLHQWCILKEQFVEGEFDHNFELIHRLFHMGEADSLEKEKLRRLMIIKTGALEIMKQFVTNQALSNTRKHLKGEIKCTMSAVDELQEIVDELNKKREQ